MTEATHTRADELTEGDIILYADDELMVYSATKYTTKGIKFDALPMAMEGNETQGMCLHPEQLVQRIGYQKPYDYNQPLSA